MLLSDIYKIWKINISIKYDPLIKLNHEVSSYIWYSKATKLKLSIFICKKTCEFLNFDREVAIAKFTNKEVAQVILSMNVWFL